MSDNTSGNLLRALDFGLAVVAEAADSVERVDRVDLGFVANLRVGFDLVTCLGFNFGEAIRFVREGSGPGSCSSLEDEGRVGNRRIGLGLGLVLIFGVGSDQAGDYMGNFYLLLAPRDITHYHQIR